MEKYKHIIMSVLASVAILPSLSEATVISNLNRANFQTAILSSTINSENFDGFSAGAILGVTPNVTYGASLGSPIVTNSFLTISSPNGLGSTSVGFFQTNEIATFSFNSAITAFAIDINTFATQDGAYSATLDIGNIVFSIFEVFPSQATGQFIGFVSDTAFTSVAIASTGFSYTLDNLVYGNAAAVTNQVPEPAPLALLGFGLLGLGLARKRQK